MITIIDYGRGNLKSVVKAFESINCMVNVTSDKKEILAAKAVVLPGVGAFGDSMTSLRKYGLVEVIKEFIDMGKPFLGICLGLQLLFEESEEKNESLGLGILKGKIRHLTQRLELKVPHMGWNSLNIIKDSPIFEGIDQSTYVYFVHSYYLEGDNQYVAATTDYGVKIGAAVWKNNIYATQFHPEKSGDIGIKILQNFAKLI